MSKGSSSTTTTTKQLGEHMNQSTPEYTESASQHFCTNEKGENFDTDDACIWCGSPTEPVVECAKCLTRLKCDWCAECVCFSTWEDIRENGRPNHATTNCGCNICKVIIENDKETSEQKRDRLRLISYHSSSAHSEL